MPSGIGTYGSKRGRPSKKKMGKRPDATKYSTGGSKKRKKKK